MNNVNSPSSTDVEVERLIQDKNLTAPRIRPSDLQANIKDVEYATHVSKSGQVLRWAVITTQSGFAVAGRPSVAVSPENDDEEIGLRVAYDNAVNELWPLMGYALRDRLAGLDARVARFLTWPVPASVCPDGVPGQPGRTGTNLLSAEEARGMLQHVLALP